MESCGISSMNFPCTHRHLKLKQLHTSEVAMDVCCRQFEAPATVSAAGWFHKPRRIYAAWKMEYNSPRYTAHHHPLPPSPWVCPKCRYTVHTSLKNPNHLFFFLVCLNYRWCPGILNGDDTLNPKSLDQEFSLVCLPHIFG